MTRVAIVEGRWRINDRPTNPGSPAEGLLMNARMVNATLPASTGWSPPEAPQDIKANISGRSSASFMAMGAWRRLNIPSRLADCR
jgi:hypothetical protein